MKKTSFLTGMFFGLAICLAVMLMVGYLAYEQLEKRPQPTASVPVATAPRNNFASVQMPKTPSEMLNFLDKIIKERPHQAAQAYAAKGDILTELGDYAGAIKNYDMALSHDPSNPDLYFSRSVAKFMAGDINGALQDLNLALQLNPQMAQAYYNRGVAHINLSKFPQAEADFIKALDLFTKAKDIANLNDTARALKAVQDYRLAAAPVKKTGAKKTAAPQQPAPNPKELISIKRDEEALQRNKGALVSGLSGMGKDGGVLEKFKANAAVNRQGDMPDLGDLDNYEAAARQAMLDAKEKQSQAQKDFLDYKGDAQKKMAAGDAGGAIKDLDKAIDMKSDAEHLYMDRANANINAGNIKAALEDLNKVLSMNPENASAWLKKAQLESSLGNDKVALDNARKALAFFDKQGNARGKANAQNEINRLLGKAREEQKGDTALQKTFTAATKNYEKGDYKGAYDNFGKMIEMQPNSAANYYNRVLAAAHLADKDPAIKESMIKDLDMAIKLDPNDAKSRLLRSNMLAEKGDFDGAKVDLEVAKRLNPDNPQVWATGASNNAAQDKMQEAIKDISHAMSIDPDNPFYPAQRAAYYDKMNDFGENGENFKVEKMGDYIGNTQQSLSDITKAEALLRKKDSLTDKDRQLLDMLTQQRQFFQQRLDGLMELDNKIKSSGYR